MEQQKEPELETCYLPLEQAGWIRLLRLPLGNDAQQQPASFERFQLVEAPKYHALSYVWGEIEEWEFFDVDGFSIPITPNLSHFLYYFQRPEIQRRLGLLTNGSQKQEGQYAWLWIDALCVNQYDVSERSSQVRLMKQIYETAGNVIVWLGPVLVGDEDSHLAVHQVHAAWEWFSRCTSGKKTASEVSAVLRKPEVAEEDLHNLQDELLSTAKWEALGRFLIQRAWWQRIWTVQESATAASKEAMCGNAIIPLVAFSAANKIYQWLSTAGKLTIADEADRGFDLESDRTRVGTSFQARSDATLAKTLAMLRRNKATDPRDKVYATLGLAEEISAEELPIDYALPVATVYLNAAKYILKTTPGLDWLDSSSIETSVKGLPSWVTDWSVERKAIPLFKTINPDSQNKEAATPVYHASGTTPKVPALFAPKEDSGKLDLKAIYIDRLATVSETSDIERIGTEPWIQDLLHRLHTPYAISSSGGGSGRHETTFQALLRTLLLDCHWESGYPVARGVTINADAVQQYQDLSPAEFLQSATKIPSRASPGLYLDLKDVLRGRRLAVTEKGFLGIVDDAAEPGDHVALLVGSQVLHIIRPCVISDAETETADAEAASTDPQQPPRQTQSPYQSTQTLFLPAGQEDEHGDLCIHAVLIDGELEMMHHEVSESPCVLCTEEDCQRYQLVGEAYVHGLMDGEALGLPGTGGLRHITVV